VSERAVKLLKEAVTEIKRSLADETIKYPLDDDGDNLRRMAAAKAAALDDLSMKLIKTFKEKL